MTGWFTQPIGMIIHILLFEGMHSEMWWFKTAVTVTAKKNWNFQKATSTFFLRKLISAFKKYKWWWNDTCVTNIGGVQRLQNIVMDQHSGHFRPVQESRGKIKRLLALDVFNVSTYVVFCDRCFYCLTMLTTQKASKLLLCPIRNPVLIGRKLGFAWPFEGLHLTPIDTSL